jgi:hypothetical protein
MTGDVVAVGWGCEAGRAVLDSSRVMQRATSVWTSGGASWLRAAVLLAVWGGAMAAVLGTWRITKAGPIVFNVTARHGVHAGDLAAFAIALLVAVVLTAGLLRRWRRRVTTPR